MNMTCVLALLPLFLELAYSFSWDIVVGKERRLDFYSNGTLTHTEYIPSATDISSVTYDPVQHRVLFSDKDKTKMTVFFFSFDISSRKIQRLFTRESNGYVVRVVYEPHTQLLFWKEYPSIYSRSLKPALSNETVDENRLVTMEHYCFDIAVDSCGGYIYWTTYFAIQRARLDGSEMEVLIESEKYVSYAKQSIAIDQKKQKMYWITNILASDGDGLQYSIESADLNGNNRTTLYTKKDGGIAYSLAVSNDFIYWSVHNQVGIWQLPKDRQQGEEPKLFSNYNRKCDSLCQVIAANYAIKEQTQGINKCEALKGLAQNNSEPECTDVSLLCVHGMEVGEESRCQCDEGYTGERCDVSLCHNYCLQGDCSINAEGQPKCRCESGFSGGRCEVNTCQQHCLNNGICYLNENNEPICQCTAAYDGERCEIFICKDYCLQGNCSVDTAGQPKCSCNAGYFGERCEVNACHGHCLNNGECSLNEKDEPVCQCTTAYEGERCDVDTTRTDAHGDNMTQQLLQVLHVADLLLLASLR